MSLIRNIAILVICFASFASAITIPRRVQRSAETCGVSKVNTGLIVRGQSFSRGSFPWIVALTYTKVQPPMFFCAGTIISPNFVVSGKKKKLKTDVVN